MTADRAASIRARLKRYAEASGQEFNLILMRYGLERFLYRLSVSDLADRFLLKGALLFQIWYGNPHRPTHDVDLLGFGSDDMAQLLQVFQGVAAIAVDDGIVFEPGSARAAPIRKDGDYGGVRVDLHAKLSGARIDVQVDVGFGDAVTPQPQRVTYPTMLADVPGPTLRAYPKATAVAEKVHAVATLGMTNSRMKDFFDLWVLLHDDTLDDAELVQAVAATFARRGTPMPATTPIGLTQSFASDLAKQTQWRGFLKRNRLADLELTAVVDYLQQRLKQCDFPPSG